MKRKLIALALAAALPVAVLASGGHGGQRHHGPDMERMSEQLELSEELRSRMAEVLTPEQQARMKEMREERREHRREGHGRRHGGRGDCYGADERSS